MESKLVDLSHTIENELITYKGLPAPIICDYLSREESKSYYKNGTSFQIGKIEMVGNTGTYLDCPFHRYADGKDLSEITLQQLADLDGVLIKAPFTKDKAIGINYFRNRDVKGKAVLVHTGWSQYWKSDQYYEDHPFITEEAACYLRDQRVALVGIDSHNIGDTRINTRPVHSTLLREDILIVEHLTNLHKLTGKTFHFSALPPKIKEFGTFPVRAFATIKN
jgi:kynurenine formamidase